MNIKTKYILSLFCLLLLSSLGFSQCLATSNCDCGASGLSGPNGLPPLEMTFDSFSKYNGGITLSGSTILKVNVADILAPIGGCIWKLAMYVDNFAAPANEWEQLANYGVVGAGTIPTWDLLQVRITNGCNTPLLPGVWQTFPVLPGGKIDIINNLALVAMDPIGICTPQVNGKGSYLQNYDEYTFTIDYRIQPGFAFQPGRYDLKVRFLITEY